MGRASRMIGRWGVAALVVAFTTLTPALADVTTERSSSIVVFPKVISDGTGAVNGFPLETVIQISNSSNSLAFAHCTYVDGSLGNIIDGSPCPRPSETCVPRWQATDFNITLTKQQPTHWNVGTGRQDSASGKECSQDNSSCDNAGFFYGRVPPVGSFVGFLVCVEVDNSDGPINGNRLKGQATLITPLTTTTSEGRMLKGEVSKYNAVGVLGLNTDTNTNNSDLSLCLGGSVREGCPGGAEYNGCPQTIILNHFSENASDPAINALGGTASNVRTELTLVPCTQLFEQGQLSPTVVQFRIVNEFEQLFSASTSITCWANFKLAEVNSIFDRARLGTRFAQTLMSACPDNRVSCNTLPGFIGVVEEFHRDDTAGPRDISRAALNLHVEGERPYGDIITLPETNQ